MRHFDTSSLFCFIRKRCVRYFNLLFFQNIIILQLSTNKQLVTIGSYRKISLKIFCYLDNWVYIWVLI